MYNVSITWANGFESSQSVKGSSFGEAQQNAAKLLKTLVEVCAATPVSASIENDRGDHYNVMINGATL